MNKTKIIFATFMLAAVFAVGAATSANAQAVNCPAGYSCTPAVSVPGCPAGYVCTPTPTSANTGSQGWGSNVLQTNTSPSQLNAGSPSVVPIYNTPTQSYAPDNITGCYTFGQNLTVGSRGYDVAMLQTFLIERGFEIPGIMSGDAPKGYFGFQTAQAVSRYQASVGITSTGYFGPETRARANACSGGTNTPTTPPVACTADAMICPDGSAVGRDSNNNCQFRACPSTPATVSPKLISVVDYASEYSSAWIQLSIKGDLGNKQVHHWTLTYTCPSGIVFDTGKNKLCDGVNVGKASETYYAYNIYDVTKDYLMISGSLKNSNSYKVEVPFYLEARNASDQKIGSTDQKTISLSAAGSSATNLTPVITSIAPSSGALGTVVYIYGSNLSGASAVQFINSSGQLVATLPPMSVTNQSVAFRISETFVGNVSAGTYQVSIVTNACKGGCDSNRLSFTLVGTVSQPTPTAQTLVASCSGSSDGKSTVSWSAQVSGGVAPYQYGWSVYNDVKSYLSGSTQSAYVTVSYNTVGTKQAIVSVKDSLGKSTSASCSTYAQGSTVSTAKPSTTFTMPTSITAGQSINFTSTTVSPSGSMKSHAVDMSTDNVNWMSGGPGNMWYWSNTTGASQGSHVINGTFIPANSGTYYFRARGTDANADSDFVFRTVTVSAAPIVATALPVPINSNLTTASECVVPGTPMTFTATVSGDGITSKVLEKDTNADGVYGQVAIWGSGPGTHTYTSTEGSDYSGTYALRLLINGAVRNVKYVNVSSSCGPTTSTQTSGGGGPAAVQASPTSVSSGGTVTLYFTSPSNTVSKKLYVSCPVGVSIPGANGYNLCNTFQNLNASQSFAFTVNNVTGTPQSIVPNFYVYTSDNPSYAQGVSVNVVVNN